MSFCWNLLERSLATLGPAARLAISLDQHKDSYRDRRETDEEERNFDPEWHEKPDRQVHRTHDLISAAVMHNKLDSVYAWKSGREFDELGGRASHAILGRSFAPPHRFLCGLDSYLCADPAISQVARRDPEWLGFVPRDSSRTT